MTIPPNAAIARIAQPVTSTGFAPIRSASFPKATAAMPVTRRIVIEPPAAVTPRMIPRMFSESVLAAEDHVAKPVPLTVLLAVDGTIGSRDGADGAAQLRAGVRSRPRPRSLS